MSPKKKPIRKLKILLLWAMVKNGSAHETVHFAPPSSVRDFSHLPITTIYFERSKLNLTCYFCYFSEQEHDENEKTRVRL